MADNCEWPGCLEMATDMVYNKRAMAVFHYCRHHADYVSNFDNPEYTVDCPNCGCVFGVN